MSVTLGCTPVAVRTRGFPAEPTALLQPRTLSSSARAPAACRQRSSPLPARALWYLRMQAAGDRPADVPATCGPMLEPMREPTTHCHADLNLVSHPDPGRDKALRLGSPRTGLLGPARRGSRRRPARARTVSGRPIAVPQPHDRHLALTDSPFNRRRKPDSSPPIGGCSRLRLQSPRLVSRGRRPGNCAWGGT